MQDFGFVAILEHMGLVGILVCIALATLSVVSVAIAVERSWTFRQAGRQSLEYSRLVTRFLKRDDLDGAIEGAKRFRHSHLARVISAGLLELQLAPAAVGTSFDVVESARRAIERAMFQVTADLKRGLGVLATIGTSAPFIGLFGTVVGIISAFQAMGQTGSGGIGAVSVGISEALMTTALSLAVAIPAVWMFNLFTNKIERLQMEMSNAASELLDFFIKKQSGLHAA